MVFILPKFDGRNLHKQSRHNERIMKNANTKTTGKALLFHEPGPKAVVPKLAHRFFRPNMIWAIRLTTPC
eukprot:5836078-Amphidinium_carterae.1